jgi:hypothetical protein
MRRAREIWVQVIRQFEKSGLSQTEFAKQRGIPLKTLNGWIYKLRRESSEGASLLPVRVVSSRSPSASSAGNNGAPVEVMVVRFANGTASELIVEVVDRLRRC